jgi:hypothetical protein
MTASYSPVAHWKFWTQGGVPVPAAGYQLWFYQAGTTTLQAVYTDTTGTVPLPNPVILDSNGECTFCLSDSLAYKILLTDNSNGPSTPGNPEAGWPVDNVQSGTLAALTAIEALLLNATVVTDGAGMISFYPLLTYPANTVGNALKAAASTTQIQNNSVTYFVSSFDVTGIPAYKLTPSPATLGYVVGQQFLWHAHASGVTGYNTLNINGLGAWPVVYIDQFGNQQPAQILAGIDYQVEYIGSAFRILNPLPPTGNVIRGELKNLTINYPGNASTVNLYTLDEIIVKNIQGDGQILSNVSPLVCNLGVVGAGGVDTGSVAANTAYYLYVIWGPATNPTNGAPIGPALIATTKLPAVGGPTLPTYYTHWARIGSFTTDLNKYPYSAQQIGRNLYFLPNADLSLGLPILMSGASGNPMTPTWTTINLSGTTPFNVPLYCSAFDLQLSGQGSGSATASFTGASGAIASLTNPPPLQVGNAAASAIAVRGRLPNTQGQGNVPTYFYASAISAAVLQLTGWEDNL